VFSIQNQPVGETDCAAVEPIPQNGPAQRFLRDDAERVTVRVHDGADDEDRVVVAVLLTVGRTVPAIVSERLPIGITGMTSTSLADRLERLRRCR